MPGNRRHTSAPRHADFAGAIRTPFCGRRPWPTESRDAFSPTRSHATIPDVVPLVRRLSPEQRELDLKKVQLAALESMLAQRQQELDERRKALQAFEQRYLKMIRARRQKLDELMEQLGQLHAEKFRRKRNLSHPPRIPPPLGRRPATSAPADAPSPPEDDPAADPTLKALYRAVALAVHPDKSRDEADRSRRHAAMIRANNAYASGDIQGLTAILTEWQYAPEHVDGADVGAELVRVIRRIALCQQRLPAVEKELADLQHDPLADMMRMSQEAQQFGRDMLAEKAADLDEEITAAQAMLKQLQGPDDAREPAGEKQSPPFGRGRGREK